MPDHRYTRTEQVIQRQIPQWVAASTVPRGLAIPIDKFMMGISRFARKIGNTFPVLVGYNTMKLNANIRQGEVTLTVNNPLPVITSGSIVGISAELHFVDDYDNSTGVLKIESPGFLADYTAGINISVHAIPLSVVGSDILAGDTVFNVNSDFLVVLGDVVLEVLSTIAGSVTPSNVVGLTVVQETTLPYEYQITVDRPLTINHNIGEYLYLRAFPAYKSNMIPLPTQQTSIFPGNVGPFLWDYVEGRLHDGITDPDVSVAITVWGSSRSIIADTELVSKNQVNVGVNIPSQMIGLWDINLGNVYYNGPLTVGVLDVDGDFLVSTPLVPAFPGGGYVYTSFSTDNDVAIRIGFHYQTAPSVAPTPPSTAYQWDETTNVMYFNATIVASGGVQHVQIVEPAVPYDRIEIGAYGLSNTNLALRDWSNSAGHACWVQYTMVGKAVGDYTWAGSGLLVKPVFRSRDDLKMVKTMDGATVRL